MSTLSRRILLKTLQQRGPGNYVLEVTQPRDLTRHRNPIY